MILPKDSISFEFLARNADKFVVLCGTLPVTMHLMQLMYMVIIMEPKNSRGTTEDKGFVIVQCKEAPRS